MATQTDVRTIWYPYTQMKTMPPPIPIVRAKGVYLYDANGKSYLDAISSWWVNLHGHSHPYIARAIAHQAKTLEHMILPGFSHEPAAKLSQRLVAALPDPLTKIFYSDNGSTAVETALKIALQYHFNQNPKTPRTKIISFKQGFHGETFGAMSVSGKNGFNRPFWDHLFPTTQIDPPWVGKEEDSINQMRTIIEQGESACFIFEPIILGAMGGMRTYSKQGLQALLQLCKKHEVLTIADEVMTGFGRTGPLFVSDLIDEKPDLLCISKGLTGGFLPLAATACTERIYNAFLSEDRSHAFLHGHSYTANPIGCAAALASLDLIEKQSCTDSRNKIAACHKAFVSKLQKHPHLIRAETLGTILALELNTSEESGYFHSKRDQIEETFLNQGILIRPLGNVLYLMPPYCITEDELTFIYQKIETFLETL